MRDADDKEITDVGHLPLPPRAPAVVMPRPFVISFALRDQAAAVVRRLLDTGMYGATCDEVVERLFCERLRVVTTLLEMRDP